MLIKIFDTLLFSLFFSTFHKLNIEHVENCTISFLNNHLLVDIARMASIFNV